MGDVDRNVLRPFLGGVEANDPDRIFVLALEQVEDHGFQIGRLRVDFAPGAAFLAEIIEDEVHSLIVAIWHDRGRPAGPTHFKLPRNRTANSIKTCHMLFRATTARFDH